MRAVGTCRLQVSQDAMDGSLPGGVAALEGFDDQRVHEVALADASGSGQDDVLGTWYERGRGQVTEAGAVQLWYRGEVEAGHGLGRVDAGRVDASRQTGHLPAFELVIEQDGQELGWVELVARGLGSTRLERIQDARELQTP